MRIDVISLLLVASSIAGFAQTPLNGSDSAMSSGWSQVNSTNSILALPPLPPGESYYANVERIRRSAGFDPIGTFLGWVWLVRPGGQWDYKQKDFRLYEAGGNSDYGTTARALGLTKTQAQLLAGIENAFSIETRNWSSRRFYGGGIEVVDRGFGRIGIEISLPTWARISPFFYGPENFYDDPEDAFYISLGYDMVASQQFQAALVDWKNGLNSSFRFYAPPPDIFLFRPIDMPSPLRRDSGELQKRSNQLEEEHRARERRRQQIEEHNRFDRDRFERDRVDKENREKDSPLAERENQPSRVDRRSCEPNCDPIRQTKP
jgi:hypothetical protein